MGDGMVNLLAFLVKYDVGKVVVFVNDEIKRDAQRTGIIPNQCQFPRNRLHFKKDLYYNFGIFVLIFAHKPVQLHFAIFFKMSRKMIDIPPHL